MINWLVLASDEVSNFISSPEIKSTIQLMISYLLTYQENVMTFNEQINPKPSIKSQMIDEVTQLNVTP